jgi:xylulokinase (EC 2.7.1.17)
LKDSFDLIRDAGLESVSQVRASGGGTKGALWRQILADVLESELVSVNTAEGGAFGAALLAGVGQGAWPDVVTACHETIQISGKTEPNPDNFEAYRHAYQVYRELYPLLKQTFTQLN